MQGTERVPEGRSEPSRSGLLLLPLAHVCARWRGRGRLGPLAVGDVSRSARVAVLLPRAGSDCPPPAPAVLVSRSVSVSFRWEGRPHVHHPAAGSPAPACW